MDAMKFTNDPPDRWYDPMPQRPNNLSEGINDMSDTERKDEGNATERLPIESPLDSIVPPDGTSVLQSGIDALALDQQQLNFAWLPFNELDPAFLEYLDLPPDIRELHITVGFDEAQPGVDPAQTNNGADLVAVLQTDPWDYRRSEPCTCIGCNPELPARRQSPALFAPYGAAHKASQDLYSRLVESVFRPAVLEKLIDRRQPPAPLDKAALLAAARERNAKMTAFVADYRRALQCAGDYTPYPVADMLKMYGDAEDALISVLEQI